MKNNLSSGMGINSVAADIICDFDETIFIDTGCEYPETYEYLNEYLKKHSVTVIKPDYGNLYEYCWEYRMVPATWPRWCTVHFKIKPFEKHVDKPSFKSLAFSMDESHRAKVSIEKDIEHRFPLIEHEVTRQGCKDIIQEAGLPLPHRSKCYICPFQTIGEWKELRMNHPDLFTKAFKLEERNREYSMSKGKKPMYLYGNARSLRSVVEEDQIRVFKQDEYPPCECML